MKKWVLHLSIAVVAVVGLACGGGSEPEPTSTPAPTATQPAMVDPTPTTPAAVNTPSAPVGDGLSLGTPNSDDLVYDTESLSAKAGETVTVTFNNNAVTQQHNWVLVQPGTKDDVALAGLTEVDTDWLKPGDPNVIASIRLLDPGESVSVTFTAPPAGRYQFVCTFPGHNPTMFGTFEVTP